MIFNATAVFITSNVPVPARSTYDGILFIMEHGPLLGMKRAKEVSSRGLPSVIERRSGVVLGKASGISSTLLHYRPAHTRAIHVLCPTAGWYCDEKGQPKDRQEYARRKQVLHDWTTIWKMMCRAKKT